MRLITGLIHTETVQVRHTEQGDPDDDGVPTTTTTTTEWKHVNIQQTQTSETDDMAGEYRVSRWRLAGPPVEVDGNDTIIWNGDEYQVDGKPHTKTGHLAIEETVLFIIEPEGAR